METSGNGRGGATTGAFTRCQRVRRLHGRACNRYWLSTQIGPAVVAIFALLLTGASIIGLRRDPGYVMRLWRRVRPTSLAAPELQRRQGLLREHTALVAVAASGVLIPNAPLGLITTAVQALARVLLPSAVTMSAHDRENWRGSPLTLLNRPTWPPGRKLAILALRGYLVVAVALLECALRQGLSHLGQADRERADPGSTVG